MKSLMATAMAVAAIALGWSGPAGADEVKTRVVKEADKTIYRKRSVVDFSEVNVEGELSRPEGSYVINRRKTGFGSRIKLRADFAPELQKSVDHL